MIKIFLYSSLLITLADDIATSSESDNGCQPGGSGEAPQEDGKALQGGHSPSRPPGHRLV